ncbi:MAG: type II toxin-antitoxin system HicA family toxin [Thermoleophilaceae bacterium]
MSTKLPRDVSGDQLVRVLERKGWRVHRTKGSHRAMEHPDFAPTISVPLHRALKTGTLSKILKVADISREEFRRLLR